MNKNKDSMEALDKIINKHTEGNYLFSSENKQEMKGEILALFNVVGRSEQLHVENACKCEEKKTFNRLQCPKCKPL